MARFSMLLLAFAAIAAPVAGMRNVPLGECYDCEVTCFEDCTLKYDREVIQMDLLQVEPAKNRTQELTEQFSQCLTDEKCPCRSTESTAVVTGKSKALIQIAGDKKKKGKCAVGQAPCSAKCGQKVADNDIDGLTKAETQKSKKALLQKDFPLHSAKINAFAKGKMTLDHCLKYCLAATCGCQDAPGFHDVEKLIKANAAVGGVTDTPSTPQYRAAKIEECAKGMLGKKVASGLFIKVVGGPGGMYEICSKDFLSKLLGPSGDIDGMTAKCKSAASDDAKFGCAWDAQKDKCVVGFSPILTCQVKYSTDPTL